MYPYIIDSTFRFLDGLLGVAGKPTRLTFLTSTLECFHATTIHAKVF